MYPAVWNRGYLDLANGSAGDFGSLVAGLGWLDLVYRSRCGNYGVNDSGISAAVQVAYMHESQAQLVS
jgi:hypothetical protein